MALRAAVSRIPSAGRPPALGRLPFSTKSGKSIGDIIEDDIASYSNLERKYRDERIRVRAPNATVNPDNGDDPFLPATVKISKGGVEVLSKIYVKPDQVHIQKVAMRIGHSDETDYKEYLRSRGITPKAISFVCDCLGFTQKKA